MKLQVWQKCRDEIRDFHKDMKQQLKDIKAKFTNENCKIAEAEMRIETVEDHVQNIEQILSKMIKVLNHQENNVLYGGVCEKGSTKHLGYFPNYDARH